MGLIGTSIGYALAGPTGAIVGGAGAPVLSALTLQESSRREKIVEGISGLLISGLIVGSAYVGYDISARDHPTKENSGIVVKLNNNKQNSNTQIDSNRFER